MTAADKTRRSGKSVTDGSTDSGRTLARHLSMKADEYAHQTSAPLYDLGDELFAGGEDVDLAHVWTVYANLEETHKMLLADLEPLVDTDPRFFDALDEGTRLSTAFAIVARELDRGDVDRHDIGQARHALGRAEEFLDELEDEL